MLSRLIRLPAAAALLAAVVLATTAVVVLPAAPAAADQVRDRQMWVLDTLHVPAAWQVSQGRGVTVAVIDSGVDPRVSDLAGAVQTGPDLTGVRTSPASPGWGVHGTWMAALIAGHGHGPARSSGIIGVAPMSRILSIRVVTDTTDPGYPAYQRESDAEVQRALSRAIRYAVNHHAGVISMSLGYQAPSMPVRVALQYALEHGTVVVASAGNSGSTTARHHGQAPYSFPADYPGVLGVGALAQDGTTATFSSANLSVQVAAPGVMVPTQGRGGKYWYVNGTSPACALTAGVAALIKSKYPSLSPALIDQAITSSTQGRPAGGYNDRVGFGTVDAAAALSAAARLLHAAGGSHGVAGTTRFGGGPAAIPPPPVRPRGSGELVICSVLAALFLALAAVAGRRAFRRRLPVAPGGAWPAAGPPRAGQPWVTGPGVTGPGVTGPGVTGPGTGLSWPGPGCPGFRPGQPGVPPAGLAGRPSPTWAGPGQAG